VPLVNISAKGHVYPVIINVELVRELLSIVKPVLILRVEIWLLCPVNVEIHITKMIAVLFVLVVYTHALIVLILQLA
jgi:hypothetical protein